MSGTGGFQTQVYDQPAAFLAGDRVSQNPIFSYDAGPGGLVSGSSVFVGRFAWVTPPLDPNGTPTIANCFGAGPVAGFVMRAQQALNTTYLSPAGNQILPGAQMALQIAGDFAVTNDGATNAVPGMKAFANYADGKVSFAAAGASPSVGASATGSSIAAATFSVTASVQNGNELNVTVVGSGTVVPGGSISGTGIVAGQKISGQKSGAIGGVGVYYLASAQADAASTTVSGTYGILTVGTITAGNFAPGQVLSATGSVVAGTTVYGYITGTGGNGSTIVVDNNTVVSSQVIASQGNIETKFYARSSGLPGQAVKISSTTLASGG